MNNTRRRTFTFNSIAHRNSDEFRYVSALSRLWAFAAAVLVLPSFAFGQASSAPALLQFYEADFDIIEDRMADVFEVGYGRMWLPPVAQASGGLSVGYDVFDRFSLGGPRNETRYGTEEGFRAVVDAAHAAGVAVNPDLLLNHNGVGNRTDPNFVALGGYPGFALTLPQDIDGDFHNPFIDAFGPGPEDEIIGQLAGLNDIAQEKNYQFIRHPVDPNDPNNIPAGTLFNRADPNNARFYPDQDLGGATVFDPRTGQNVTLYNFNAADPLAGDPVLENAMGLLQRNVRWMIQEFDIDGFRIDAARHHPLWVLDLFDQAAFLAKREPLLDGSPNHVYSFIETGFDSAANLQNFIRRDIDNNNLGQVGGNRDALDFRLFNRLKDNLTGNGASNNWHVIKNAPMDLNDDGLMNGSQGVAFVQSHDETGAFLSNVAHAYTLMLPGNSLVYLNAEMDGPTGTFPQPGKVDALGGFYGETITKLVELRNSHGRGDFQERWLDQAFDTNGFSNVYMYERENSALVALNSRNDSFVETRNGVQTAFAPGTVLVELTGNAADPTVDPGGVIADAVRVDGSGRINVSIPSNGGHGRGYVIYGVAKPEGSLSLTNVADTLEGANQNAGNFGTARIADVEVITADTFTVRLDTTPVTLPAPAGESSPVRDVHADGDTALIKINGGIDLNGNGSVDVVAAGDVAYGFEEFTTTRTPGYIWDGSSNVGTGSGVYEQEIDVTQLAEGRHYITARAFRHRNSATGGDGGPAVFSDFKQTIYVDRLPPESAIASFEPFPNEPSNTRNRDLIIESVDKTADSVHVFMNLGAEVTDAEVLAMVSGSNRADDYDRDKFIRGIFDVQSGNHAITVVSFEPTGNVNVQRFVGQALETNLGVGFGDLDGSGFIRANDVLGLGGFKQVLFSQNQEFNPSADFDGDGRVDATDLFALEGAIAAGTTDPRVYNAYVDLLEDRADFDDSGEANADDLAALYAAIGGDDWLYDVDSSGAVSLDDAQAFVTQLLRTSPGDFNLDGQVNAADYTVWRNNLGLAGGGAGDADFDGDIDADDYDVWRNDYGFARTPFAPTAGAGQAVVPEPTAAMMLFVFSAGLVVRR